METAIELRNVSYVYGDGTVFRTDALDCVSVKIEKGKMTGIIGHTGSGKSTMVQMMNGLIKPTSGSVYLFGEDIFADKKKLRDVRFRVGLVFQYPEYQLFEESVYKDIAFGPANMKLDTNEIDRRVRKAAMLVGLEEELFSKSPFELSGGQKRRVAIAGVMAMEPEVLVLDEPASGLDPVGRNEIFKAICSFRDVTKGTVVIVSHSMEDMAKYADNIIVMNHGECFASGSKDEVFQRAGELCTMGLDVPQITSLITRLKSMGMELPDNIYTVEAAVKALSPLVCGRRGGEC